MFGKKTKIRFFYLALFLLLVILLVFFLFKSLEKSVVYFLTPSEIFNTEDFDSSQKIRIGGMVKKNSLIQKKNSIIFIITDFHNEILVTYSGAIPNLFAEGKGVVAEGSLKDKKYFFADTILAKHDENYMPPKIKKAMEEKGQN